MRLFLYGLVLYSSANFVFGKPSDVYEEPSKEETVQVKIKLSPYSLSLVSASVNPLELGLASVIRDSGLTIKLLFSFK